MIATIDFIKKNFKNILIGLGAIAITAIAYIAISNFFETRKQREAIQPIVNPIFFLNLEPDMNRLSCIFEQRRCYYSNLGLEKGGALVRCGDIKFCDEKYRIKK